MQNLFLITSIALSTIASAQSVITVQTVEKFSTGMQPSISTTINGNIKKEVINEWKKILKDFKNEKVKDKDDEVFADNIVIKDWGNNPVDIFSKFDEDEKTKTIKMSVAVDLGGKYLAANDNEKFGFIDKMVREFAVKMTKAPLEEELKNATKQLGRFEDDAKNLVEKRRDLKVDIENYTEKIKKAEEDIKTNEENQAKKKTEIETQKKLLEDVKKKLDAIN